MEKELLSTDVFSVALTPEENRLVQQHLNADPARLALSLAAGPDLAPRKVIQQISARQKAARKLPEWCSHPSLVFPPSVSVEQSSSQATALYKATLIGGEKLIDLTLGMGIDTYYLSRRFRSVTAYEQQPGLAAHTAYNFARLGASNIEIRNADAVESLEGTADWIYADPARRDLNKNKVVALSDCTPDIPAMRDRIFRHTSRLLLKTSPVLDISLAVATLKQVTAVHVVGAEKECKEVLYIVDSNAPPEQSPDIHAVIVSPEGHPVHLSTFTRESEAAVRPSYGDPLGYLYEPHPAFLKSGGFNTLSEQYGIYKLAPATHLYTSEALLPSFPGRSFRIRAVCAADKKAWEPFLREPAANLTIRNFPSTVNDLRRKWRLKEGGRDYLFATTLFSGKKAILVTEKTTID